MRNEDPAPPPNAEAPQYDGLALVAKAGDFEQRHRIWRGRSGQRYLVTVMPLSEALSVTGAVILLVARHDDDSRQVIWAGESDGPTPGLFVEPNVDLEAHVHLLAQDVELRAMAVADLVDSAQGYSSVLTVSADANQASSGSDTPSLSSSKAVLRT